MPHRKFFSYSFRVYIEDTDAGGIVYHANHLKYMERTRTEWLRSQGIDHYLVGDKGNDSTAKNQNSPNSSFSFVVHELQIAYHQPALMDNLLIVTIEAVSVGAASFVLLQRIERDDVVNGVTKRIIVASAKVKLACLNDNLKPRRLPSNIRDLIETALQD
ncbi:MAG: tol-pal system-associated acyl-CoA thioesterase [Aquirhabdus sp.]